MTPGCERTTRSADEAAHMHSDSTEPGVLSGFSNARIAGTSEAADQDRGRRLTSSQARDLAAKNCQISFVALTVADLGIRGRAHKGVIGDTGAVLAVRG